MGKLSMELYPERMRARYKEAKKREKGELLSEFCEHSGYHRKHAIRLLNQQTKRRKRVMGQRGRRFQYGIEEYLEPLLTAM